MDSAPVVRGKASALRLGSQNPSLEVENAGSCFIRGARGAWEGSFLLGYLLVLAEYPGIYPHISLGHGFSLFPL